MGIKSKLKAVKKSEIRLDFGCGPNKMKGFTGVDSIKFDNVDIVLDISKGNWPWKDSSVIEARASHFVEHLTAKERIIFVNELYRVLIPGSTCQIITPHWASCRAYGDPTHQWPPVSEFWFYYLDQKWRDGNAPHTDIKHNQSGYKCDFNVTWGYSLRQDLMNRNLDFQQMAISNYKEVCQDTIATLVKK